MKTAFLDELAQRRPEIVRRWRKGLKDTPRFSALGNPDTLRFMIEPVLDKLFSATRGRTHPPWSPQAPPSGRLVDATSRCALNPLIGFYLTGEAALGAVARELRPHAGLSESEILTSENELLVRLRKLGHQEITGFCEICRIKEPAATVAHQCASVPLECPFKAEARERKANGAPAPG
jgi:hypothetical protein